MTSTQLAYSSEPTKPDANNIDTEYFDAGISLGILNIEDFGSEFTAGVNLTFNATENFFMQMNYLQANADESSFELSQGNLFSGGDRNFKHYDFLVGYNLFQGEHFFSEGKANLSSLYVVAGVGDTEFGGEGSFTYTTGIGYQFAIQRSVIIRLDFRDYIYKTNIIGEDKTTHNTQLGLGISYLF